jgi:hypothetical protein
MATTAVLHPVTNFNEGEDNKAQASEPRHWQDHALCPGQTSTAFVQKRIRAASISMPWLSA